MAEAMFRRCSIADILDVLRKATSPYHDRNCDSFLSCIFKELLQVDTVQITAMCDVEIEIDNLESSDTLRVYHWRVVRHRKPPRRPL